MTLCMVCGKEIDKLVGFKKYVHEDCVDELTDDEILYEEIVIVPKVVPLVLWCF